MFRTRRTLSDSLTFFFSFSLLALAQGCGSGDSAAAMEHEKTSWP